MHTFGLIFLAALLLTVVLRLWLATRHAAHVAAHRDAVPAQFSTVITLDAHQRAADYTCAKTRFAMIDLLAGTAVTLVFTFGGGLQALHELTAAWLEPGLLRGLALIGGFMLITMLIDIPFSLYRTFVIEEKFGFNKITPKLFWIDLLKGLLLGAVLGLPLAALVLLKELWKLHEDEDYRKWATQNPSQAVRYTLVEVNGKQVMVPNYTELGLVFVGYCVATVLRCRSWL
jgi:STE24 endopeptidase